VPVELMKNKQYNDAIKILIEDRKRKIRPPTAARSALMLGECYYLVGNYTESQTLVRESVSQLRGTKKRQSHGPAFFDLPIIAVQTQRLSDLQRKAIDIFSPPVFPSDSARAEKLMVYKMSIPQRQRQECNCRHRSAA